MNDSQYMQRCLQLAKLGLGDVAPNPMVGCVIVHDDNIIGEGYHKKYGQAHAEVNAIQSVQQKELFKKATLYVNLEPCAHYGKTPPCADLIVENNIPNVVIGCVDDYSEVSGKGIEKLKGAGVNVKVGILEKESLYLNRRFFTFHNKQRPYVILKWAQSSNGFIDIDRSDGNIGGHWITALETKQLTHKWRHEEAGILVGKQTVINDNPELTVRAIDGNSPTRFVIDRSDVLDLSKYKIGNKNAPTIKIKQASNSFEIKDILNQIYEANIQSVIIEGGKKTIEKFIGANIWDEARILIGKKNIDKGSEAPVIHGTVVDSFHYGNDFVKILENG